MIKEAPLFDRIRFHRQAAAAERCHIKVHLLRYSVGGHTHDVLSLFIQCWREAHEGRLPRAEAMAAMHIHDHPELVTGDIGSHIKDRLGGLLDEVEHNVDCWLGLSYDLTDEEKEFMHAADRLEFCLWAYEEMLGRGNRDVLDWLQAYLNQFAVKPLPEPFMRILQAAEDGLPHLTRKTLFEAGGMS